jgi:predicted DNA-binding transcriptional regulator AlpA
MDLVGIAEIASKLGVSRQRASQLSTSKGFPAPAARLGMGPVWRTAAVERWIKQR